MGRYHGALKTLDKAIYINKEFAVGHLDIGIAYDLLGDGRQVIVDTA